MYNCGRDGKDWHPRWPSSMSIFWNFSVILNFLFVNVMRLFVINKVLRDTTKKEFKRCDIRWPCRPLNRIALSDHLSGNLFIKSLWEGKQKRIKYGVYSSAWQILKNMISQNLNNALLSHCEFSKQRKVVNSLYAFYSFHRCVWSWLKFLSFSSSQNTAIFIFSTHFSFSIRR